MPTRSVSSSGSGGGGGGGSHYYGGGGGGGSSYRGGSSSPSSPHTTPPPPAPKVECPNLPNHNSAGKGGGGGGTPPIVVDLNRNGITSISMAASIALFDYDGDGNKENTAWIENSDALLVNDVNNDGIINNASELFGNYTRNSDGSVAKSGYQALSYYDTNSDGVVNATDTRFSELKLWIDIDQDGVTDTGELKTLSELGVASINLGYSTNTDTLEERNAINQTSTFTTTDGTTQTINDVWFATESRDTARDTEITLKESVAALPDYRGAGRVENLSTAMNNNTKLETAVTALLTKSTTATYDSLLGDIKNILALWTKTDNISATATRGVQYKLDHYYASAHPIATHQIYAYARDVAILESFWGQNFTMNVEGKTTSDVIGTEMSAYMTNAINTLTDTVLATLLVQSLYGKEAYDVTNGSFDYAGLFSRLDETLTTGTTADKTTAANLLATLIHRDGLQTLSNLEKTQIYPLRFKNNYYKQKKCVNVYKIDNIKNCFYMFNKKVA